MAVVPSTTKWRMNIPFPVTAIVNDDYQIVDLEEGYVDGSIDRIEGSRLEDKFEEKVSSRPESERQGYRDNMDERAHELMDIDYGEFSRRGTES